MSNMSYCRFRNTLEDFRDCVRNIEDRDISDEEAQARYHLIKEVVELVERYDLLDETNQESFNIASDSYQYEE